MKPQDLLFLFLLFLIIALLLKSRKNYFTHAGILCFIIAIPFFAKWVFFTAERLISYGFAFILASVIIEMIKLKYEKE